jgi:hypothetical protein
VSSSLSFAVRVRRVVVIVVVGSSAVVINVASLPLSPLWASGRLWPDRFSYTGACARRGAPHLSSGRLAARFCQDPATSIPISKTDHWRNGVESSAKLIVIPMAQATHERTSVRIDGHRLARELQLRGLASAEFAKLARMSPSTLSGVVAHDNSVSARVARRIAKALHDTPVIAELSAIVAGEAA